MQSTLTFISSEYKFTYELNFMVNISEKAQDTKTDRIPPLTTGILSSE